MAATAIATEDRARPSPIRFKLKLDDLLLFPDEILFPKNSYKDIDKSMKMREMAVREGTGISKERKSCLFMNMPCCTEKVDSCAKQQLMTIVLPKIGRRHKNVFVSSTSVFEMFLFNIALSKHLIRFTWK